MKKPVLAPENSFGFKAV